MPNTIELYIKHPSDWQLSEYVNVTYQEIYNKGIWTFSNGDPGIPAHYELEIHDYYIIDQPTPSWITEDIIYTNLENHLNNQK
jgi:hypothetical protein